MPRPIRTSLPGSAAGGVASATSAQSGRAPMAARSDRFTASAFQPISSGVKRRVKWTPSTTASTVATSSSSAGSRSTAASSPMPTRTPSPRVNGRVKRSMSSNSPGRAKEGYPAAAVGEARTASAAGPDAITGSETRKVVPAPGVDATFTVPAWAST